MRGRLNLTDVGDTDAVGGVDRHVLARLGALPRLDASRHPRREFVELAQDAAETVDVVEGERGPNFSFEAWAVSS